MYPFTFLCEHEKSSFCSRLYVDVLALAKRTTEEETFYLFYEKQLIRTPFLVDLDQRFMLDPILIIFGPTFYVGSLFL